MVVVTCMREPETHDAPQLTTHTPAPPPPRIVMLPRSSKVAPSRWQSPGRINRAYNRTFRGCCPRYFRPDGSVPGDPPPFFHWDVAWRNG